MSIILLARDHIDLPKHLEIKSILEKQGLKGDIKILCGEKSRPPTYKVDYIYAGYKDFCEAYRSKTNREIAEELLAKSNLVPSNLYKADRQYIFNFDSTRELEIEQLYLINQALDYIDSNHPSHVFMTGGGNLVRNVFYSVAKSSGIHAYRVLNAQYLNPKRNGARYWFCSNNYCLLSEYTEAQFDFDLESVDLHSHSLISDIKKSEYKLDKHAKSKVLSRASISLKSFFYTLVIHLAKRVLRRKDGIRLDQIRSAVSYYMTRPLTTKNLAKDELNIVYALNVPEDAQITLRASHFVDQLSVCQQICNVIPHGVNLVIKEHPGHLGMLSYRALKNFLRKNKNAIFMGGEGSMMELLNEIDVLVVMNSTSALEAFLKGVPVVTLGPSYYRDSGLDFAVKDISKLGQTLESALNSRGQKIPEKDIYELIGRFLQETWPEPNSVVSEENQLQVIAEGINAKVGKGLRCNNSY